MGIYRIGCNQELQKREEKLDVNAWIEFKKALNAELSLFPYPLEVFKKRLSEGNMNVVIDNTGVIIATVSIFKKFTENIQRILQLEEQRGFWEIGSSWTHKSYRNRQIHRKLRKIQLSEVPEGDTVISHTKGRGTSGISEKLEWTLLAYDEYPFVCSFAGWPLDQNKFLMPSGLTVPARKLFLSSDRSKNNHEWEMYHHFWISDYEFAKDLEGKIRLIFDDNIVCWRKFLIKELGDARLTIYSSPKP